MSEAGWGRALTKALDQRDDAIARAERAEAEVARLREVLAPIYEHMMNAGPTGWAGASDLAGASAWEREAEPLLQAARVALADSEKEET